MATAPTMQKTRMTPGSRLAQLPRFIRWETAFSLRATRDISRAAIAAVEVCLGRVLAGFFGELAQLDRALWLQCARELRKSTVRSLGVTLGKLGVMRVWADATNTTNIAGSGDG